MTPNEAEALLRRLQLAYGDYVAALAAARRALDAHDLDGLTRGVDEAGRRLGALVEDTFDLPTLRAVLADPARAGLAPDSVGPLLDAADYAMAAAARSAAELVERLRVTQEQAACALAEDTSPYAFALPPVLLDRQG